MILTILAIVFALTAGLDIFVTERVLSKNPDGELNPLTRWLAKHVKPIEAAIASIVIPRGILVALCSWLGSAALFGVLVGMALDHAWKQLWCRYKGLI